MRFTSIAQACNAYSIFSTSGTGSILHVFRRGHPGTVRHLSTTAPEILRQGHQRTSISPRHWPFLLASVLAWTKGRSHHCLWYPKFFRTFNDHLPGSGADRQPGLANMQTGDYVINGSNGSLPTKTAFPILESLSRSCSDQNRTLPGNRNTR